MSAHYPPAGAETHAYCPARKVTCKPVHVHTKREAAMNCVAIYAWYATSLDTFPLSTKVLQIKMPDCLCLLTLIMMGVEGMCQSSSFSVEWIAIPVIRGMKMNLNIHVFIFSIFVCFLDFHVRGTGP